MTFQRITCIIVVVNIIHTIKLTMKRATLSDLLTRSEMKPLDTDIDLMKEVKDLTVSELNNIGFCVLNEEDMELSILLPAKAITVLVERAEKLKLPIL